MQLNHAGYANESNYMRVIAYHRKIIKADKQVEYPTAILQGKRRSKAGNPRTLAGWISTAWSCQELRSNWLAGTDNSSALSGSPPGYMDRY